MIIIFICCTKSLCLRLEIFKAAHFLQGNSFPCLNNLSCFFTTIAATTSPSLINFYNNILFNHVSTFQKKEISPEIKITFVTFNIILCSVRNLHVLKGIGIIMHALCCYHQLASRFVRLIPNV
ncbi:hypothetical protein ACJX0J_023387 [Zea mays]